MGEPGARGDDAERPRAKQPGLPGPKPIPKGGIALDGFKAVFAIRDFRMLFWGQAISALGDWVGTLAFIAAARAIAPGEPAAVVGVLILRLVPSFFATPIGGVLSDRFDRKRIMIWSDVARFGILIFTPFVPELWALYVFAFAHECFSLVFLPARDASLPNIVGSDHLEPANAVVMGSSFAGIPLSGPAFALLAYAAAHLPSFLPGQEILSRPYAFAFVFDAFTFLVSASFIARIALPKLTHDGVEQEPFWRSLVDGARFIRSSPLHRGLAYAVSLGMLGGGVLFALGIGYIRESLGGSEVEFGWLMGIFGAGMVAGFLVSQIKAEQGVKWMIRGALLGMGAVLIVMAVLPWLWMAYLMALVFGTTFSVSLILSMSLVQARTPDAMRGRVMAFVHIFVRAALVFGGIASGVVGQVFERGIRIPVVDYRADRYQIALLLAGGLIMAGVGGVRGKEI
ncbi:MAG: MFS transporter [Actinomycetota bacterium]